MQPTVAMRTGVRHALHVQSNRLLPVGQHRKGELQKMGVVDGKPNHDAHKLKLHAEVNLRGSEPVHAGVLVQLEHAIIWVKHVPHQELEKFLHAAIAVRCVLHQVLGHLPPRKLAASSYKSLST